MFGRHAETGRARLYGYSISATLFVFTGAEGEIIGDIEYIP